MPSLLKISGNENKVIGGNGELTPEQFAAAGISVTETAVRPTPAVSGRFGSNTRDKSFFEKAITTEWRKNVASIVQTGKLLNQAKDELACDDFAVLKVPFEPRVSQMLRRIAANLILSSPTNFSSLPPCWRTLYELTKLSDARLRAALADGRIHPGLKQKEVRLLRGLPPAGTKPSKTGGQAEAQPDPFAIWNALSSADKTTILDTEGRVGLAKIASSDLLADLVDHEVAQQIASGPNPKLRTYTQATLTKIFWKIISAAKEDDMSVVSAACAGLLRKCQAFNCDYRDLRIASPKKCVPKRG